MIVVPLPHRRALVDGSAGGPPTSPPLRGSDAAALAEQTRGPWPGAGRRGLDGRHDVLVGVDDGVVRSAYAIRGLTFEDDGDVVTYLLGPSGDGRPGVTDEPEVLDWLVGGPAPGGPFADGDAGPRPYDLDAYLAEHPELEGRRP